MVMSAEYDAKHRYRGSVAAEYSQKRSNSTEWLRESRALRSLLDRLPMNQLVLDLPFGTGRFASLYRKYRHRVVGIDISRDMLDSYERSHDRDDWSPQLVCADGEHIPLPEDAVDIVVSVRLFNWLPPDVRGTMLDEFTRVCRDAILLQIRVQEQLSYPAIARLFVAEKLRHPVRTAKQASATARRGIQTSLVIISRHTWPARANGASPTQKTPGYTVPWAWELDELLRAHNLRVERVIPISRTVHPHGHLIAEKRFYMLRGLSAPGGA